MELKLLLFGVLIGMLFSILIYVVADGFGRIIAEWQWNRRIRKGSREEPGEQR